MKNITLSAEAALIEQARLVVQAQHKTLNAAFREWLEQYAAQAGGGAAVDAPCGASGTCGQLAPTLGTK